MITANAVGEVRHGKDLPELAATADSLAQESKQLIKRLEVEKQSGKKGLDHTNRRVLMGRSTMITKRISRI